MSDLIRVSKRSEASLVIDCNSGIAQELSNYFSFFVEGYKFMPAYKNKMWDGKIRLFDIRTHELPIGLWDELVKFAAELGREYPIEVVAHPVYGTPGKSQKIDMSFADRYTITSRQKKIEPRDYQLSAVHYALSKKGTILISPTASGKSLMIYLMVRYYLETHDDDVLIVVPTKSLVTQMLGDFADYSEFDSTFDAENETHIIMGGKDKNTKKRIIISTWQSIYKERNDYFQRFGMVLGDEAHLFKAKSLVSIMSKCTEAEYRIGTTGTLDGSQTNKVQLTGLFGPVKQVTTTKERMDAGDLSDMSIDVLLLKYSDEERQLCKKLDYANEVDLIVRHEKRNNLISNLAVDLKGNTLVLFQFVDKHGKPLHELIEKKAGNKRKVFYVSGETDAEAREEVRKLTEKENDAIIVASLGTFSTGVNIRNIHNIIFATPTKSQVKVLQSIGRGLRKSDNGVGLKLYDIADDLSWKQRKNYTVKHAAERIKIYTSQQFKYKIHEVNL